MPIVTAASSTANATSAQRSGDGSASSGTKTRTAVTTTAQTSAPMTPSVTHSPIAERDSDQAGSRTGAGASAVIAPILSATPAVIMGFVPVPTASPRVSSATPHDHSGGTGAEPPTAPVARWDA